MNTLNEIRFDDKDLFFNDNIVKTSILPQGTKDLKRNIKVQANSVFEGSVFGNNVEIEDGGVIFKGAVFANTELHVGTDISGTVKSVYHFLSSLFVKLLALLPKLPTAAHSVWLRFSICS